jgi:hypothetical protein
MVCYRYWKAVNSGRDDTQSTLTVRGPDAHGDVVWGQTPYISKTLEIMACDSDEVKLTLYEVDDITFNDIGNDDDYLQHDKVLQTWLDGESGEGDGIWSLQAQDTAGIKQGKYPVRVTAEKVAEKGVPVATRRMEAAAAMVPASRKLNLRKEKKLQPARADRRRLHHDDCVTAYYHMDVGLEMSHVSYARPEAIADFYDPVMNFIGFDDVTKITLYNNAEPVAIDVLPYNEVTLHNFEGFDCAMLRTDPTVWESYIENLLRGDPAAVGATVGAGVAVVAGTSYAKPQPITRTARA